MSSSRSREQFTVVCPNRSCGKRGTVSLDTVGRTIACMDCGTNFKAVPTIETTATVAEERKASADKSPIPAHVPHPSQLTTNFVPQTPSPAVAPASPPPTPAPTLNKIGRFRIVCRLWEWEDSARFTARSIPTCNERWP